MKHLHLECDKFWIVLEKIKITYFDEKRYSVFGLGLLRPGLHPHTFGKKPLFFIRNNKKGLY